MPSTLITVANRGLGLEFARQYLADGWQVYAACRDPDSASELRGLADDSDDKLQILVLHIPKDEMKSGREDFNAEVPDDVTWRLRWYRRHTCRASDELEACFERTQG
jgi:NAD(P)-dependent dehydrogenase (short-subunit alcohol dehydrogenase family)